MSDAAYADESAEDLIEDVVDEPVIEDDEPAPEKDWQKIAHDKEGALAKERSRRKAESSRARDLEARLERLEGSGKTKATDAELLRLAESLRDDDDDPITDIASLKRFAKQYAAEQREALKAEETSAGQQRVINQISSRMSAAEEDFRDDHPDYDDAQAFYKAQRKEELEELGYSGARLNQELGNDLLGFVSRALQAGRDPAEAVYNMAKKRGFGVDGVAKKLQTIQRSQDAGRTITGAGRPTTPLTAANVAKLSGDQFDKAFEKLRAQSRRAS